jgi:hypothetical protein
MPIEEVLITPFTWSVIGVWRRYEAWYVMTRFHCRDQAEKYVSQLSEHHAAMIVDRRTEHVTLLMLNGNNDAQTISNYCPF